MAEHHDPHASHGHGDPDPEIQAGPVAKIMVAIAVLMLLAAALMWPLAHGFLRSQLRREPAEPRIDASRPAGPLLQESPEQELRRMRAREDVALHSYGWVDEFAGVARIPVDRATELVLEEGLIFTAPAASEAPPSAAQAGDAP
jgi:hypothetical protein